MRMYLKTTKDISYRKTKNSQKVRVHSVLQNGDFFVCVLAHWLSTQIVYFGFQNRLEDKLRRTAQHCWALLSCPEEGGLQGRERTGGSSPGQGRDRAEVRPPGPRLTNSGAPCSQPRLPLPPHTLWGLEVQKDENSSRFSRAKEEPTALNENVD